jgi:hypothetical protein
MREPSIEPGMRVTTARGDWYCVCGHCKVSDGEVLRVVERRNFAGIGVMLQFAEHQDDDHEPWFLAMGFKPRHDG